MTSSTLPLALFVAINSFLSPFAACAAEPSLRVSLSSDQPTVTMASQVTLTVKIDNSGDTPIWIFGDLRWGADGGLILHVGPWSKGGPLPLIIDHETFTGDEVRPDVLVKLNPDVFLGRERKIEVRDLVRQPGTYRMWIEYRCPIPSATFKTSFWGSEHGSSFSPAIVLKVSAIKRKPG